MIAVRTHFDGDRIELPDELRQAAPQEVIVIFEDVGPSAESEERDLWLRAQEAGLAKIWENDEDAVYDNL